MQVQQHDLPGTDCRNGAILISRGKRDMLVGSSPPCLLVWLSFVDICLNSKVQVSPGICDCLSLTLWEGQGCISSTISVLCSCGLMNLRFMVGRF
jgi:hypothetical protein